MTGKISIESLSYLKAPIRITSNTIEKEIGKDNFKRFGLEIGFMKKVTGIKERRYWEPSTQIHEKAAEVSELAIKEAGINKDEIGCIINASVFHDYLEPTLAVMIHDKLGLSPKCLNFDISNACAGFASAIEVISALLKSKSIKYGLIVAAESSRRLHDLTIMRLRKDYSTIDDFENEFAALTLGSGAAAMILCREEDSKTTHRINGIITKCDSKWNMLTYGKTYDQLICNSREMLTRSIDVLEDIKVDIIEKFQWHLKEHIPDFIVPHQISKVHAAFFEDYAKEIPKERMLYTYEKLGNIGPASWPITMAIGEKEHDFTNKKIGVCSIGSGFNAYAIDITW